MQNRGETIRTPGEPDGGISGWNTTTITSKSQNILNRIWLTGRKVEIIILSMMLKVNGEEDTADKNGPKMRRTGPSSHLILK